MPDADTPTFGGGQAILVEGDALVGGSDPRKDGYAAGSLAVEQEHAGQAPARAA